MGTGSLARLLLAGSAVVGLTAATTSAAHAQQPTQQAAVLEEIIVTATKRAENLQEVPVSVGTVAPDKLEAVMSAGVDLLALSGSVPSLYAESTFARTFPRFYIRGLGNSDFDLNSTQPVGVVLDEVVQENPLLRGFPLFDIARVEVLRGPQGTLFGRNTPAGTISFISNKPSEKTEAYFNASYGKYNTLETEGAVGGAVIDGVLSARLSLLYERRDDFVDNTFTGEDDALGGYNEAAARLQFLYDKGGPLTALFNVHARDLDGTARIFRANIIQRGSNDLVPGFRRNQVFQNGQNDLDVSSRGGSLRVEYDLGSVLLTSITGYETVEVYTRGDIDGGVSGTGPGFIPFDSETADEIPDHAQWTQEVRLTSQGSGPFRWQAGVFYFNEDVDARGYSYGNPTDPRGISHFIDSNQESTSWAVFGQANYDITDQLTLTGGLRYNDDEKDYTVSRTVRPGAFVPASGPVGTRTGAASVSGDRITWDVSLTYKATDDINLFGRVASGYRAPSISGRVLFPANLTGGASLNSDISTASAEKIMSYEAGVKSDLWGNKARLNLTGFYSDIKDQQFVAVGGATNVTRLLNADKGIAYGFEAELELLPVDNLLLTGGLSYNYTEIDDPNLPVAPCGGGCTVTDPLFSATSTNVRIDGNPFPNAPKWLFTATARYSIPLGTGEAYIFTDWNYRSKVNFFLYESREFQSDSKIEGGLKIGYLSEGERFGFAVFGRNITNAKELEGAIDFNNLTGIVTEAPFYGVEVTAKF
ncbi:TonB-dependent receptor [Aerophototrophica crusticola]|uniref:TonB-dependent receptor n=2 Tax=Aerophototrophica crusticola TaxID=1709002 RepID=A0A858RC34_9PROT|nr:TonB-dependent receptor [Rhodospirillaceae bacterium B3]